MNKLNDSTKADSPASRVEALANADTVQAAIDDENISDQLSAIVKVSEEEGRERKPVALTAVPGSVLAGFAASKSSTSYLWVAGSVAIALLVHLFLLNAGQNIRPKKVQKRVTMEIVKPPPPKVEEPPPPKKEEPPPPKKEIPKPKKKLPPPPKNEPPPPPPSNSEPPPEPPSEPVTVIPGLSIDSTVKSGASNFKVPVGNTTFGKADPSKDGRNAKKYAGGVPGGKAKEAFKPVRVTKLSTRPKELKKFKAKYPRRLKEEGVEGQVRLRVEITKTGKTKSAKVIKSLHPLLDKLARQSLMRFRWKPATVDGVPVDTKITYVYTFAIDQ